MKNLNLYIHIPFCFSKCPYCNFFSKTSCENKYQKYFEILKEEIAYKANLAKNYTIQTIYIGGGTPNLVPEKYISECIEIVKNNYTISPKVEITIELYPQYITEEKLKIYKNAGINRLSIGLQSTDDNDLKILSRRYTYSEFLEKYEIIKNIGFSNLGIDLIFGYPGHTLKKWQKSLKEISKLDVQHISCYSLEIEENTPYGKLFANDQLSLPTEEENRSMYHFACDYLEKNGFKQYEISNFSKTGFECMHNLNFWNYEDYLGFGAGAYSRFNSEKYNNPEDIDRYINREWEINKTNITQKEENIEKVILGLRLNKGIPYQKAVFNPVYMERLGQNIRLNIKGKDMYNTVVSEML